MEKLWRKKSVKDLQAEALADSGLKRTLSAVDLTAIGIGATIGAGIFVLTGQAAANYAGPAIVFSFMLAAVASALAAPCYAEFASMIPIAGSAYTYSYATLGEFFAWFIGWDLLVEYSTGAAAVAVGWSGYAVCFLDLMGIFRPSSRPSRLCAGLFWCFVTGSLTCQGALKPPGCQWSRYSGLLAVSIWP